MYEVFRPHILLYFLLFNLYITNDLSENFRMVISNDLYLEDKDISIKCTTKECQFAVVENSEHAHDEDYINNRIKYIKKLMKSFYEGTKDFYKEDEFFSIFDDDFENDTAITPSYKVNLE